MNMRVLTYPEIKKIAAEIAKYPDRSTRKIVLMDRVQRENLRCIQKETGYRPRKRKSA